MEWAAPTCKSAQPPPKGGNACVRLRGEVVISPPTRLLGQLPLLLVQHIHVLRNEILSISCQTRRGSFPAYTLAWQTDERGMNAMYCAKSQSQSQCKFSQSVVKAFY